jgi:hypothetical protein
VSNGEKTGALKKIEENQNSRPTDRVRQVNEGFCTPVHRFAQEFRENSIDGAKGKYYFAFQIEPGSLRTLRINLEGAASLTAVAPRD